MTEQILLRRGAYHDSVTLLRITQAVADTPGVTAAQVAMATELNVELTRGLGFEVPDDAAPTDLLIAVRGNDEQAVQAGLAAVDVAIADARTPATAGFGAAAPPRTVRTAAAAAPDADLVLLSVPGPSVLGEALDALEAGRHVMVFSDNVPVEHEVILKQRAEEAGLLVMGPDCGTAIVAGVGLGFANVLVGSADPGSLRVGIVAASGTGAQQLSCLLDEAGAGVSHLLGVGGRDLSAQVGGRSAIQALAMLDADPDTGHIVVLSKPPDPTVADSIRARAARAGTPVTTVLLGAGQPNLTEATEAVLEAIDVPVPDWPTWGRNHAAPDGNTGALRGLYAGGTLADEAMLVAGNTLGDLRSNIPLRPELALPDPVLGRPQLTGAGHAVVDLGDDAFTRGRPHPMIDPSLRLDLLAAQAADPDVRVLLLDVVLGHGAEADPAARLAPAIRQALRGAGRPLAVVVSLIGTLGDPQHRDRQAAQLAAAGAAVFVSNAAAARTAAAVAAGEGSAR
jgi:FdrA protein